MSLRAHFSPLTLLLCLTGSAYAQAPVAPKPPQDALDVDVMAPLTDAFETTPVPGAQYGLGVASEVEPLDFAAFAEQLAAADSLEVAVVGEVSEVCQVKGCWMTLQSPDSTRDATDLTVRFKDYGFFMPKTLPGHRVVVEGKAYRRVLPVDELRHYAEDAGKSAEEIATITEPEEQVEFTATGVRVL